jgi:hypothetical protein
VSKIDIGMENKNDLGDKRRFIVVTCASFWLIKTIMGGVIYATSAFFTKQWWEKWKARSIKFFDIDRHGRNQ